MGTLPIPGSPGLSQLHDSKEVSPVAPVGCIPFKYVIHKQRQHLGSVTTDGDLSDPSISNSTNDPLEPTYEEVSPPLEGEIPEARGDEVQILQKQLQEEKNKIIKAQKIIQELRGELQFQMNTLRREIHKKENAFSQVTTAHFCLELEEMSNRQHVEMINFVKRKL